jgi:hypothetical protein
MKYIGLLVLVLLTSCNTNQTTDIEKEINSLKTQTEKENYLLNLFKIDQQVRNSDEEYEIKKRTNFDENSTEYLSYLKKMAVTDSLNFEKIKLFIKFHGYPDIENKNSLSYAAIPTIMLHQGLDNNSYFFSHLYNAYLDKKLTSEDFSSILNRMYRKHFDYRYKIDGTTSTDQNINALIENLNLTTN